MPKSKTGIVNVISYRTTREDSVYRYPIEGAISGTSVSHIALKIIFNNQELFNKYIAGNPNIPYDDSLKDPLTGERLYEVYFSFWPINENVSLQTTDSRLLSYTHDCEDSAMFSPMHYRYRFARYLRPNKETVSPNLPILNYLLGHTITLPPSIILHVSRFKNTLINALKNRNMDEINLTVNDVVATAEKYSQLYDKWFDVCVEQQNASKSIWSPAAKIKILAKKLEDSKAELTDCSKQLKSELRNILFSGNNISEAVFLNEIDKFITFGLPEVDSITLPLTHKNNNNKNYGLELEPMLEYIKDIADNPRKYKYNLLKQNCSTMIMRLLDLSVKSCPNQQIAQMFRLPWYVRLLGLPVSPAMVMQFAAKAEKIESLIQAETIPTIKNSFAAVENCETIIKQRSSQSLVLESATPILRFTADSCEPEGHATPLEKLRLI